MLPEIVNRIAPATCRQSMCDAGQLALEKSWNVTPLITMSVGVCPLIGDTVALSIAGYRLPDAQKGA